MKFLKTSVIWPAHNKPSIYFGKDKTMAILSATKFKIKKSEN